MYGYFKPRLTLTHRLVVNMLDNETRGPGLIPGWAPIFCMFFFFLFLFKHFNAELFRTSKMTSSQ